ncbi:MAG: hypothetical protein WDM94_12795 [Bauldia sp.]
MRQRRRLVVGFIDADIGAGRHDLVDPVQHIVRKPHLGAGEELVELGHRARTENGRGHAHAIALAGRQHVALDAAVEHRVGRLLGAEAGEIRAGVEPGELLGAVASLSTQSHGEGAAAAQRMVALLVDGLRYGAKPRTKKRG